jgi:hypothetical protein
MRRVVALSVVVLATLAIQGSPALGATNTLTETVVRKNVTESFSERDPCLGRVTINLVYNDVFHITEFISGPNEGNVHVTFTQTGRFLIETARQALPNFRGHFAIWGGFNGNRRNATGTFTFNAVGRAPDGTRVRFHATEHFNVSASGIENSFLKERFDCPA